MRIVLRDLVPDCFEFERGAHDLDSAQRQRMWHGNGQFDKKWHFVLH